MPQYLAQINDGKFKIIGEHCKHLTAAVRAKEGDIINIFDGTGKQYKAIINIAEKMFVSGDIQAEITHKPAPYNITLCFAPVSKPALEEVLDKCTQLGVFAFQPVFTQRTEHDILKRWENKKERWEQIILAATKQCGVPLVPALHAPLKYYEAFGGQYSNIIAYEGEQNLKLAPALKTTGQDIKIFIGPAGGFTQEEYEFALKQGAQSVTLGNNILRAETAAIAAIAIALQ